MAPLQPLSISIHDTNTMETYPQNKMTLFQSSSRREKKSVSFMPIVFIRRTIRREDYSDKEQQATWVDRAGLKQIRTNLRITILKVSEGSIEPIESETFSIRGLESFLPEGQALKQLHREAARNAVLDEQEYQWEKGTSDPERIANLCCKRTRKSAVIAHVQAVTDHEVVLQGEIVRRVPTISMKKPIAALLRTGNIGALKRRRPSGVSSRAA